MSRKVIFDTDPGIDDAMALLFLHHHRDIDLIGITTVFGNASIEVVTRNALHLKSLWDIVAPVAKGTVRGLNADRHEHVPPAIVHGDNGLGNIAIPDTVPGNLDPRPAHRFIIETVRANPHEVTIVAVGRMTNLALALAEDPQLADLVKEVVIMGGAVDTKGNVTPVAEANIFGDPEAADIVMTARWKVVMIGLDVTSRTIMSRAALARLGAEGGERAQLLVDISQHYVAFYESIGSDMMVHDSCACAYVVAPQLFTTRPGPIRVVVGGIADGQTIQSPDGPRRKAAPWVDQPSQLAAIDSQSEAVLRLIHDTITRKP
ncbi:MAG TPA: nucleoside hydrolase [Devosiaceae bacterium]|jgi:inosine-uridine nucleoside N-ribohydrolase